MIRTASSAESEVSNDRPPPCRDITTRNVVQQEFPLETAVPEDMLSPRWRDWQWQLRNRIRTIGQLRLRFPGLKTPAEMAVAAARFPLAITPYYSSLIQKIDGSDPIFRMCVPQGEELFNPPFLTNDPLHEDADMPVPGLVHRYRDRALLIATSICASYCRHCTRKRVAGQRETSISDCRLQQSVEYLRAHPEIRDIVVSGGDPFTMATSALEDVIAAVRSVPSVDMIRVGTRTPVVLPMRITDELVAMLRKYHPIYVNTHFNHPNELTAETREACVRMVDAGIPMGNQTVLLRGVNDDATVLETLFRGLMRIRVRPYYLFQCDLVRGVEHFRTPLSRGIEIMEYLRGRLSGLAIPTFVVDAPQGGGKIPLLPNYVVSVSPTQTVLRNFEGVIVSYPEPSDMTQVKSPPPREDSAPGVWELATGQYSKIQPRGPVRHARRRLASPRSRARTVATRGEASASPPA